MPSLLLIQCVLDLALPPGARRVLYSSNVSGGAGLLLLFLIPVLLLLLAFIGFNFYKSKINIYPAASLTKNTEGKQMSEFGLLKRKSFK